jgi:hypothetical protein
MVNWRWLEVAVSLTVTLSQPHPPTATPTNPPPPTPPHLHSHPWPQPPPRVRHVDRPVQPDDVGPCRRHALQQAAAAVGVEREGDARVARLDGRDHAREVGAGPAVPLARRELAAPAVKDLDGLGVGGLGRVGVGDGGWEPVGDWAVASLSSQPSLPDEQGAAAAPLNPSPPPPTEPSPPPETTPHLRPGLYLVAHVLGHRVRQVGQQAVEERGGRVRHRLDGLVEAAAGALGGAGLVGGGGGARGGGR